MSSTASPQRPRSRGAAKWSWPTRSSRRSPARSAWGQVRLPRDRERARRLGRDDPRRRRASWVALAVLVAATAGIDAVYLGSRAYPLKFLVPGTVFLLAFQVTPIFYNVNVAFTNWSTGPHHLEAARRSRGSRSTRSREPANGGSYVMAPARDENGKLVLLLLDDATGKRYVGTSEGLEANARGAKLERRGPDHRRRRRVHHRAGRRAAHARPGARRASPCRSAGTRRSGPQGLETAIELEPTLRYDAASDTFTRISDGLVFPDNGQGSFVAANGEELEPGWKTHVGLTNFKRARQRPAVREPVPPRLRLDDHRSRALRPLLVRARPLPRDLARQAGLRFRRVYRSLLVVPYAVPGFLSLLVWAGLLNDDFGVVNSSCTTSRGSSTRPGPRSRCSLVSVWLTFPYFFLVSLGALQSIPGELVEAARVDGAAAAGLPAG